MIRGLLSSRGEEERLLLWHGEDGWQPLCRCSSKGLPDEPFPRTNDAKGLEGSIEAVLKRLGGEGHQRYGGLLGDVGAGSGVGGVEEVV